MISNGQWLIVFFTWSINILKLLFFKIFNVNKLDFFRCFSDILPMINNNYHTDQFVICRTIAGGRGFCDRLSRAVRVCLSTTVHGLRPVVDVFQEQTTRPWILPGMEHRRYEWIRRWLNVMMELRNCCGSDSGGRDGCGRRGGGERWRRRRRPFLRLDQSVDAKPLEQLKIILTAVDCAKIVLQRHNIIICIIIIIMLLVVIFPQQIDQQVQTYELQIVRKRYVVHGIITKLSSITIIYNDMLPGVCLLLLPSAYKRITLRLRVKY